MEGRPHEERELVRRAKHGDERALEAARPSPRGGRVQTRLRHHRKRRRGRGGRPAGLRQGLARVREVPRVAAVSALAPADRRERGAQPPARVGASRRARGEGRRRARSRGTRPRPPRTSPSPQTRAGGCSPRSTRFPSLRALVLACRYLLDLSEAETAAALGVRRGTVKSRTARALEQLRGSYE